MRHYRVVGGDREDEEHFLMKSSIRRATDTARCSFLIGSTAHSSSLSLTFVDHNSKQESTKDRGMKVFTLCLASACALLLLLSTPPAGVIVAAAASPISFFSCASGPSILRLLSLTANSTFTNSSSGQLVLSTQIEYEAFETITGGTYNVTITTSGPDGDGPFWGNQYSGQLSSVLPFPIPVDETQQANIPFNIARGWNNFTVSIYDQNVNEVLCFEFGYHESPYIQHKTKAGVSAESVVPAVAVSAFDWPPYPYTSCSPDSVITISAMTAAIQPVGGAEYRLNTQFTYTSAEIVTSGTYNLTQVSEGVTTPQTGSLSDFISLPIAVGSGSFQASFLFITDDQNSATIQAYDQNQEEIMCISFQSCYGCEEKEKKQQTKIQHRETGRAPRRQISSSNSKRINHKQNPQPHHRRTVPRITHQVRGSIVDQPMPAIGTVYFVPFNNTNCQGQTSPSLLTITSMNATVVYFAYGPQFNVTLGYEVDATVPIPTSSSRWHYESTNSQGGSEWNNGVITQLFAAEGGATAFPLSEGEYGTMQFPHGVGFGKGKTSAVMSSGGQQLYCITFVIPEFQPTQ